MTWRSSKTLVAGLLCLGIAAVLLQSHVYAQSKGNGVEVLATSPKIVETEPGQIISASFSVRNTSSTAEEFIESLELPAGWDVVIPPNTFVLDPGETAIRIVAFLVPANTPAGSNQITYSVRSQRDYGIQDFDTITVVVLPAAKFAVLLEEKPDTVIAGDQYQATFRVINQSNSSLAVKLTAKSSEQFPVTLDTSAMTLTSGSGQVVTATVRTSDKIRRRVADTLSIRAEGTDEKGRVVTTGLVIVVETVPKSGAQPDIYHRIPSEIRVVAVGGSGRSGFQGEFSGYGSLDEEGQRNIDFLFRAPDIQSKGFYGLRDEYRLNYLTPDYDLWLGDQSYGLSPLTDYYRYGRGAQFDYRQKTGPDFGVYFLESRWESPEMQELGLHIGNRINDRLRLRLNLLDRTEDAQPRIEDRLISIEAFARLFAHANLEFELASGHSDRSGQAYRVRLDGSSGGAQYSLGAVHASPDFFGYYSDADYRNAAVSFPLVGRLRGNLSLQTWRQNLRLDPLGSDAPKEQYHQAGFDYALTGSSQLSVDSIRFRRQDLLSPASFDFKEEAIRLGYGQSFANTSLRVYYSRGRQDDLIAGNSRSVNRYAVYLYQKAGLGQHVGLYSLFGDRSLDGSRLLGDNNTVGASAFLRPADSLSVVLSYAVNGFRRPSDLSSRNNRQFYMTAVYDAPDERVWTLRLRNSNQTLGSETSCLLSYTIPWDIPVAKKRNLGSIHGRVYDAEQAEKPGIARVIVTANGVTAATDNKGDFEFSALPAGPYQITVEKRSIGLDRTTTEKLPIVVQVETDKAVETDIAVSRSVRVSGKTSIFAYREDGQETPAVASNSGTAVYLGAPGQSAAAPDTVGEKRVLVPVSVLGDSLIEFTRGSEVVRTATDKDGSFSLADLRPGVWQVKVYDYNLPAFHYIELPEFSIELKPGGEVSLPINVLPRLRQVRIIEQDTIR